MEGLRYIAINRARKSSASVNDKKTNEEVELGYDGRRGELSS
jgi:hypothetical protein